MSVFVTDVLLIILCSDESRYLTSLEESGWLQEIETLIHYALCIAVKLNNDNTSVLISVGSGVERVAQVNSFLHSYFPLLFYYHDIHREQLFDGWSSWQIQGECVYISMRVCVHMHACMCLCVLAF